MIPDFKTYIKESVWSDIHKRSNGTSVRKEDDIDLMSAEGLYNYIKDTYLFKSTYDIFIDEKKGRISINLYDVAGGKKSYLSLNDMNGEKYIILSDLYTKHMQDLLNAYYHVVERSFRNPLLDDFIIRPKDDGEITNKFFIEVLDFLIDNADGKHQPNLYPVNKFRKNESVWSDIHKRSNGTQERKEDDLSYINDMTVDDFMQFLRNEYPSTPEGKNTFISEWDNSNVIGFPIIINDGFPIAIFLYNCKKGKKWIGINSSFERDYPDIISIIEKKYKIEWGNRGTIKIYKDDPYEDITNLDFIKLIDYLLNNITHHTLARKKRVNESVWSDIHKRSNGTAVRKEDEINHFDAFEFYKYLYLNYWPTGDNDGETIDQSMNSYDDCLLIQIPVEKIIKFGGAGKITLPITIDFDIETHKIRSIVISSILVTKYPIITDVLEDKYEIEQHFNIVSKNGKLTNMMCVDIIDRILNMVNKPLFRKNS